jgi:hypothetical protein
MQTDVEVIPLAPPYVSEPFGFSIFFPARELDQARLLTPGRKHLEIDTSTQRLRAYDENGRLLLNTTVSTGKPGIDEKGRQQEETRAGIHHVSEVRPFRRWSKDPKVKMLDWIGILPGIEKGIHSLEPVGEFTHYEKLLGQKASHGCIRVSRHNSRWLVKWMGADWKTYPFIVYIYQRPSHEPPPSLESPYRLMLIRREGAYRYSVVSQDSVPSVQRSETVVGHMMRAGDFLLYRQEPDGWHLVRSSQEER